MKTPAFISRFLLSAMLLLGSTHLLAQQYVLVDEGSKVKFTIVNHLIFSSTVTGYFTGLKGNIHFDPDKLKETAIEATVAVNTINTGIGKRDRDLMAEKYFNTAKFPVMKLVSTSVTAAGKPNTYQFTGALTIKGITKTISFPFTTTMTAGGCQFNGQFVINRKDFQVGPDNAIDDKLTVILNVQAKKQ